MVSYFREAGPRLGLPKVWKDNKGISIAAEATLAKAEGLKAFPFPNSNKFTTENLYAALKQAGPLWCAGSWFGPGHIIVLTGVDGSNVYFNDPGPVDVGTKNAKNSLAWFNQKLDWSDRNAILYRPAIV